MPEEVIEKGVPVQARGTLRAETIGGRYLLLNLIKY